MVLGLLLKSGMTVRSMEMFYKEVVYEVLLYRSEIWVITESTMKVLGGFHNRISQRISGKMTHRIWALDDNAPRGGGPGGGSNMSHVGV